MASYGAIALAGAVPPRRSPGLALVALALCAVAAVAALASWVQVCVCACVFCVACTRLASAGPDSPARPAPPAPARDAPPAPPALQAQPVALEQFEIVPLGGFRGGRPMMGLFLGDDAAKNLPEARVFETDGVSARARAIAGRRSAPVRLRLRVCGAPSCAYGLLPLLDVQPPSCSARQTRRADPVASAPLPPRFPPDGAAAALPGRLVQKGPVPGLPRWPRGVRRRQGAARRPWRACAGPLQPGCMPSPCTPCPVRRHGRRREGGRATDVDSFPPPLPPRRPPPPPPPAAGLPPHLGLVRYRHPGLLETLGEEKSCRQSLDSPSHSHTGSARGRRGRCRGYPRRVWGAGGGARWGLCVCVRACFYMYHFCVFRAAGTLWRLSASSGSCAV